MELWPDSITDEPVYTKRMHVRHTSCGEFRSGISRRPTDVDSQSSVGLLGQRFSMQTKHKDDKLSVVNSGLGIERPAKPDVVKSTTQNKPSDFYTILHVSPFQLHVAGYVLEQMGKWGRDFWVEVSIHHQVAFRGEAGGEHDGIDIEMILPTLDESVVRIRPKILDPFRERFELQQTVIEGRQFAISCH